MRPRVLANRHRWTRQEDWDRLAQSVELVEVEGNQPYSEKELIAALQGCQGLIRLGRRVPDLTRRVIEGAPDLKIVGLGSDRFGTGVDLEAAAEHGVTVVDTDNAASAQPVAEWVLALILLCLRNAGAVHRQMLEGTERWGSTGNEEFVSGELTGRRVGLAGCGHIGQRLIELLAPFRVDLKVFDPYLGEDVVARLRIVRKPLDEVLRHAEIFVVQVPLTTKTTGMIGARELDLLATGSILINCCRGRVVDQQALIRKLERRELIAGLDVFDPEPLAPESPLRSLPNVFVTPHIAYYAPNALRRYFAETAAEIERFFKGEPLRYELTRRMVEIRHGRI